MTSLSQLITSEWDEARSATRAGIEVLMDVPGCGYCIRVSFRYHDAVG